MPVMEVVLQQSFVGQQIINRWNYIAAGSPASVTLSFALASALGAIYDAGAVPPAYPPTGLMRLLAACQSQGVSFDFLGVRDIYSVTDFYEAPFLQPLIGAVSGESLSPAAAFGFRTNRVRTDVRRGQKRFVGLVETQVGSGGILQSVFISGSLQPLAVKMGQALTYDDEGNTITFTPCVCGKEKYLPDPDEPNKPAYRYYDTEVLQLQHTAQGIQWDNYAEMRTQTSRQYRRGR